MPLTTFSNFNEKSIDWSEFDEEGDQKPSSAAEAANMGGADEGPEEEDDGSHPFDWKVGSMGEDEVGQTLQASSKGELVMKRLITPGDSFDNPQPQWEVELVYTGRIAGGGAVFDRAHAEEPRCIEIGTGALVPRGLEIAVRTMRLGEKCVATLKPEVAFGDMGDKGWGVPGGATVEYEIELRRTVEVSTVAGGEGKKRTLVKSDGWESPQPHAEVEARWSGAVVGGSLFQPDVAFRFTAGSAQHDGRPQ